ncbi:MAG: adenylate/guanylate cyclase domain-containing protein [Actinomycetota bacterium]
MAAESGSYPLPEHPVLAEAARAVRDDGAWAQIFDVHWHCAYATDELRRTFGAGELVEFPLGRHAFGPEFVAAALEWRFGPNTRESLRAAFGVLGGFVLADAGGDRDELRAAVDPMFHPMIDDLEVRNEVIYAGENSGGALERTTGVRSTVVRLRDDVGNVVGTAFWSKPALGTDAIAAVLSNTDVGHLERMQLVTKPARRPAALLFADLEGSTPLARRLSTPSYFSLTRRLVRAADRCTIEAGGLVGRHVGDGVVAFFLAETSGSESAAARACIEAARHLRAAIGDVAARANLDTDDLAVRFGLHWGSTLYVGGITTSGRSEVTALGDEVNEAARIEACASGGRVLASKSLVERLDVDDASGLGIDPDRMRYTMLGELPTAGEKARRDAPAIAVCEL